MGHRGTRLRVVVIRICCFDRSSRLLTRRVDAKKSRNEPTASLSCSSRSSQPYFQRLNFFYNPAMSALEQKLVLPVSDRDHIRGDVDAPATLVEYGDYECPD